MGPCACKRVHAPCFFLRSVAPPRVGVRPGSDPPGYNQKPGARTSFSVNVLQSKALCLTLSPCTFFCGSLSTCVRVSVCVLREYLLTVSCGCGDPKSLAPRGSMGKLKNTKWWWGGGCPRAPPPPPPGPSYRTRLAPLLPYMEPSICLISLLCLSCSIFFSDARVGGGRQTNTHPLPGNCRFHFRIFAHIPFYRPGHLCSNVVHVRVVKRGGARVRRFEPLVLITRRGGGGHLTDLIRKSCSLIQSHLKVMHSIEFGIQMAAQPRRFSPLVLIPGGGRVCVEI